MRVLDPSSAVAIFAIPAQQPAGLNRRDFLKSSAAAGLVFGLQLPLAKKAFAADAVGEVPPGQFAPNAFIRIAPDNTVTLVIKHHEMGQGATTGLATILCEELDADLPAVKVEYAPSNAALYKNLAFGAQGTGGSTAIANSWEQLRKAGATGRAMLVSAAAKRWNVSPASITVSKGVVSSGSHKATFGELANDAATQPVPADVPLKDPKNFVLVGKKETRRLDSQAKCTGTAIYTIDVKLPGLLTAVIARPPAFGVKLVSFDAASAKAVKGVTDVVEVPEGVAIVATGMWPALQGRRALKIQWDGSAGKLNTAGLYSDYLKIAEAGVGAATITRDKNTAAQMKKAVTTVEAVYEFPYLAHAPMEPLNCVAWLHDGMLETWGAHQFPSFDHMFAAQAAGLPVEKVKLNSLISGGSFGRRANAASDFTVEAVNVAKAIGRPVPVRVQRTREDDMRAGWYRPLYVHTVKTGLDARGELLAWQHAIVGQSIMAGTPMAATVKNGNDASSTEGVWPTPYKIPAMSADLYSPVQDVRPLWWRSVGNTHTAYVMETMLDELATLARQDPVAYRLKLLADEPRMAGVIKLAADKAGWNTPMPAGKARGVASHFSFDTYVAQVAEVSLKPNGQPKVERVVVAVDCGVAVNPDQIAAQMEGCVGFALAAALYGELDIENGAVKQSNYHDFRVLRIDEMPKVEVYIADSQHAPTGVGEPGVPPLAPAVANALAKLTGTRVRRLPLARQKFQLA
ncbi:MAG: xanthine dehydrogenase family protein molybdopterin-binding subunit [Hydrocarboniphaga sp.]|uniref:xanthine dehydrogenase family protein molybdopterin-binding subunit n=1 Tax=Hydrocarboniphaga sp. TaxID=2033016 RepID=UPI00260FF883|nr:xanthine dehydrogenase family protein molybdopterin-binding subunit [Hydrocarboniphaga sp.]MDB5968227.1 xanthine dehydrogenase family protein molybdopterin-binding subunit [Hydrocarboniphaga sp.]